MINTNILPAWSCLSSWDVFSLLLTCIMGLGLVRQQRAAASLQSAMLSSSCVHFVEHQLSAVPLYVNSLLCLKRLKAPLVENCSSTSVYWCSAWDTGNLFLYCIFRLNSKIALLNESDFVETLWLLSKATIVINISVSVSMTAFLLNLWFINLFKNGGWSYFWNKSFVSFEARRTLLSDSFLFNRFIIMVVCCT